jgi:phosphate:Na+ symporter
MIPFVSLLARLFKKIIPSGPEKEEKKLTKYLDDRFLNTPFVAVSLAKEEVLRLGRLTLEMLKDAEKGYLQGKLKSAQAVLEQEPDVDQICHIVTRFMEDVPGEKLNLAEHAMLERLKHLVTDIERVGDHAVNLAEFARQIEKKDIKISKTARKELKEFFKIVSDTYAMSLKAFKKEDYSLVEQVVQNEDEVDRLEKKCKRGHVERLRKGLCQPEADPIFVETLRNLERISDHSYNIALSLKY